MHMPLLWTDCETTGLDPKGRILEYAMALTDEDLRVVSTFHVVIGASDVRSLPMAKFARETHERNGLLDEVERSHVSLEEAEQLGLVWAKRHGIVVYDRDDIGPYMAGSSPQFDRGWYSVHMPTLVRIWHYRNVDMTTLRYFFGSTKGDTVHRALPDVLAGVEDLRRHVSRAQACGLLPLKRMAAASSVG